MTLGRAPAHLLAGSLASGLALGNLGRVHGTGLVAAVTAALALAGLRAGPPDVSATIAERERLADGLRSLGLEPLPSWTNFLLVRHERASELARGLLAQGLPVRPSPGAIRITVHRPDADDRLLAAVADLLAG